MRILLILLVVPIMGFTKVKYNEKYVISHFKNIVNDYRKENGLPEIKIDENLRFFSDNRAKGMKDKYVHSTDEELKELPKPSLNGLTFAGENIANLNIPTQNNRPYYSSYDKNNNRLNDISDILNKFAVDGGNEYDVAMYCFLTWKYSTDHNKLLLNKNIKWFYLSYEKNEKSETIYHFAFISVG